MKKILITGGGGYVGAALSDYLIDKGYEVTVYDLFIYGKNVFNKRDKIEIINGDIRDINKFEKSINNHEIIIHLACISNDPSFELNPTLGKSINLDAFEPMVLASKKKGVKRFIYASSSSVYGVKSEPNVTENMLLEPLTDYSRFKVDCEEILLRHKEKNFETVVVRPATVCGYSKRQRLDVIVNILTNLAYHNRKITVFGGSQLRPNIHITDMIRSYETLIEANSENVNGEIFNAAEALFVLKYLSLTVFANSCPNGGSGGEWCAGDAFHVRWTSVVRVSGRRHCGQNCSKFAGRWFSR